MSKIVLHVDDSATMQMVADITFRGTEYTCVSARSVDDALEKAKAQRPTLVLADAQMPGKTGYDLCLAIKSDPKLVDVPVVILCGNAQPFDAARGGQVGADGTLPKPWDSTVMLEKVGEAVEKASKGVARPGGAMASAPLSTGTPLASAPTGPSPATATSAANPAAGSPVAAMAAAAAKGVPQPPRSATIMGMPTIKMPPAGNAAAVPVTSATPPAAVAPAPAASASQRPPGPATAPIGASTLRAPAVASAGAAPAVASFAAPAAAPGAAPAAASPVAAERVAAAAPVASNANAPSRAPMVSGTPTKRSALVERTLAKMAAKLAEASGLEPGSPELLALLKLSTEVVERIVWEVVPELAEQIIRENLEQLTAARRS
jgi:CheY-like chemotaxis protein